MRNWNVGIAAFVMMLTSCGTFQNRYGPEQIQASDISPESAVVVISVGSPEYCAKAVMYLVAKVAGSSYYDKDATAFIVSISNYAIRSDFADHHGYLHALRLRPGSYYLAPRWLNDGYVIKAKRIPKADFSVGPGEVIYMGEFYIPSGCSLTGDVEIRDQEERDMDLLRKRNPSLAGAIMSKRIPALSGYALDLNE